MIAGEAPWQWIRLADVREPVVVIQVVPDLRWTGGSYSRVAGRIVSYPVLALWSVFALLYDALTWLGDPDPPLAFPEGSLWWPTRAAYHFKGDFLEARLLRDSLEVSPIEGRRDCATQKLKMARRPTQKPRVRKIRGCWGSYTYPAEAFAPGAALSLRLVEQGREDRPEIVPLPPALVERIRGDAGRPQTDCAACPDKGRPGRVAIPQGHPRGSGSEGRSDPQKSVDQYRVSHKMQPGGCP